jgi:hypothetical protein
MSVVYRGFKHWSGQIRDYKIGICCFCAKHEGLRLVGRESEKCVSGVTWPSADCCISELAL